MHQIFEAHNFRSFADWLQTAKIKLAKCFIVYACIRSILGLLNLFSRNVQYNQTVKIMHLENLVLYGIAFLKKIFVKFVPTKIITHTRVGYAHLHLRLRICTIVQNITLHVCAYSGTPLLWTPWGPHFRGKFIYQDVVGT